MPSEALRDSDPPEITALKERLRGFETAEGRMRGVGMRVRASDVFVATPPKCGTTWMQMIIHQLRSGGDMSFEEISNVVPFIEIAGDLGIDVDADQQYFPRAFKTHLWYGSVPKGGRYIVILRDPMDVVISFYNFFAGWFFPCPGSDVRVSDDPMSAPVGVDDFIEHFFLRRGRPSSDMENAGLWEFILSWLPHVKGANRAAGNGSEDKKALIVFYEDMLEDHVGIIRKVARFLDLGAGDEALTQKVATMSTFEFMKANEVKFDEHPCKEKRNAACGLLPTAGLENSKVRGHVANRPQMSEATKSKLAERWRATIGAETGYSSYAELRAAYGSSGTL